MGQRQRRSTFFMVYIEPTLNSIAQRVADGKSLSSYARGLIIKDLKDKGLLTEDILAEILAGPAD